MVRSYSFSILNVAFVYILFFRASRDGTMAFAALLLVVMSIWAGLQVSRRRTDGALWLVTFFTPLTWLFVSKTLGFFTVIGLSYLSFRVVHLLWEVQNERVREVPLAEYLSHIFFLPTYLLGPISPFSYFQASFNRSPEYVPPVKSDALLRILKGLVKFVVIASIFQQLTPDSSLLDYREHRRFELIIAILGFYLYLYANFSGFNDLSIGAAALMGILVKENFNQPYLATSCTEFWKRWHISLSEWMRDIVFSPLVANTLRRFPQLHPDYAIALSLLVVFLLIGWWHGNGWQFWLIGFLFGLAVVIEHFVNSFLRRAKLDKSSWFNSFWILWAQRLMTNFYVAGVVSLMSIDWAAKGIGVGDLIKRLITFMR